MGAHSKNSFQALCSEALRHCAARQQRAQPAGPRRPSLTAALRAPRTVYFIIYATAQGIMDAYEEAVEQVRLRPAGPSLARPRPRPRRRPAAPH